MNNNQSTTDTVERFIRLLGPGQDLIRLFENIPGVYFFFKDRESRFMGGSASFVGLMGETDMDAIIGKTDHDYSPGFLADAFFADDQWVMQTGESIINKIELVPTADGSLDWLCTTKVPLCGEGGEVMGVAGITRIILDSESVYADHPEMHKVVQYVQENYGRKISAAGMAATAGISVSSMERLFRNTFGLTPLMYLRKTRLNAACRLLRDSSLKLREIAERCGFNEQTNMTRAFRQELKITPLRYRRSFKDLPKRRGRRRIKERISLKAR